MDEKAYWVGFNLVKGIGAVRFQLIKEYFSDLPTAWSASRDQFLALGLQPKIVDNFINVRNNIDIGEYYQKVLSRGINVVISEDEEYPSRLKEIEQSPPVLYYRGEISKEDFWAVAIVGTRRITSYGRQVADEISSYLARNGITIISGLARGVDAIAHQAALRVGGRTLAVLGCGVDRIYPPEHRNLTEEIVQQGAVVSDYPLGTPPDGSNFPPRNRIISGLSMAVVVIEAGQRSGALITANYAADQGRDVFAVPGNIQAHQSKGSNMLIQQGAHPLLSGKDVLEALNLERIPQKKHARRSISVDTDEASLLDIIGREPIHIDEIRSKSGLAIESVSASLAIMELKGLVQQVGGMNYVSIRDEKSGYDL
ncbi:DNA-processing protein DprA [Chloroflexota bacterium]